MSENSTKKPSPSKPKSDSTKLKVTLKEPPFVFDKTQVELANLSKALDCPVLVYFKPSNGSIWPEDLYAVLECLKVIGKTKKLALYIRSNGGSGMVSLRIINLLRSFTEELIILAPSECASAATMIALGCDEIQMSPLSSLSPVDSSLTHSLSPVDKLNGTVPVSLDELWRVLRLWKEADDIQGSGSTNQGTQKTDVDFGFQKNNSTSPSQEITKNTENPYKYLYEYIHPLVFGAVDRYSSLSVRLCEEILGYHMKDESLIKKISHSLNYDYPAHSYPITFKEAQKIGLPVKEITQEVWLILNRLQLLYSEFTNEQITDYDKQTYHNNSIYSVVETQGVQVNYKQNYDKFYLENEKRYIILNDLSSWIKVTTDNKKKGKDKFVSTKIYF